MVKENPEGSNDTARRGPRQRLTSVERSTGFLGGIRDRMSSTRRSLRVLFGAAMLGLWAPRFLGGCGVCPSQKPGECPTAVDAQGPDAQDPSLIDTYPATDAGAGDSGDGSDDPDLETWEPNCLPEDFAGTYNCHDGCIPVGFRCNDGTTVEVDVCEDDIDDVRDNSCPDGYPASFTICQSLDCEDSAQHEQYCGPGGTYVKDCGEGLEEVDFCGVNKDTECDNGEEPDFFCVSTG